ncbi:MAG: hypothetical protein ACM3S1_04305 [Hyphomicrobiales bacterium]
MATAATSTVSVPRIETSIARWSGLAGLLFAVSVAAFNIVAQAVGTDPAPDAAADEILQHARDHKDVIEFSFGWVAVNVVLLGIFISGLYQRVRERAPIFARLGLVGAIVLMVFFPLKNVPVALIVAGADSLASQPQLVEALWRLQLATFALAQLVLGLALVGFSVSAARARLVPNWVAYAGPLAALTLIAGAAPLSLQVEGSNAVRFGVIGFVSWLVFVGCSGVLVWRGR